MEFGRQIRILIVLNNLALGLSEIVEGAFFKFPIFRQDLGFSTFRPDFPLLRSYLECTAYIF